MTKKNLSQFDEVDEVLKDLWETATDVQKIKIRGLQRMLLKKATVPKKQKIKIEFTESDLQDLQNGETFDWTYTTNRGEDIDVHLYNEDYA